MADEETRRILNEELRHRLDIQRSAAERVETKAAILLGFAATAMQFVVGRDEASPLETATVIAWCATIIACLAVVTVRPSGELDPEDFVNDLWSADAPFAHTKLVRTRLYEFERNRRRLTIRTRAWLLSSRCLAAAGILSALHLSYGSARP